MFKKISLVSISFLLFSSFFNISFSNAKELKDDVYYANCSEAKAAGAAPLKKGEPGYRAGLDRDGDGVACE